MNFRLRPRRPCPVIESRTIRLVGNVQSSTLPSTIAVANPHGSIVSASRLPDSVMVSTTDFDSVCPGSNPGRVTEPLCETQRSRVFPGGFSLLTASARAGFWYYGAFEVSLCRLEVMLDCNRRAVSQPPRDAPDRMSLHPVRLATFSKRREQFWFIRRFWGMTRDRADFPRYCSNVPYLQGETSIC